GPCAADVPRSISMFPRNVGFLHVGTELWHNRPALTWEGGTRCSSAAPQVGQTCQTRTELMKACRALLIGTVGLCGLTIFTSGVARAQEDEAAEEGGGDEPTEGEADGADEAVTDEASDEGAGDETAEEGSKDQEAGDGEAAASASVVETPGKSYQFVGLRYRGIIVPTFMMNLFGEGGDGVYVHAFGPEFAIRKDNFEYNFSIWYADYGMDPTPFKAKDDPIEAYEIVESKLKVLYLTADFLWSTDVSPEFAINYGMGAGLGVVLGDVYRQQAYP